MTTTVILGAVATLFTLAAALGSAIAILRSSALRQTVDVQAGTIAALEKARSVDHAESVRHKTECSERIAALEGRSAALESLAVANIADAVAAAVVDALEGRIPPPARRPAPRKRAAS